MQLNTASALAFGLIVLAYHFVGEAARGQTPGNQLDSLPILYLLGLVVILATGQRRQRIGDLAARTQVVRASGARR